MSTAAICSLMAERKALEAGRLQAELDALNAQSRDLAQRSEMIARISAEYEQSQPGAETTRRFDASLLAARQYLLRLADIRNKLMLQQADLQVRIERKSRQLLSVQIEGRRFEKLGDSRHRQEAMAIERAERRAEEGSNLMLFHHRRRPF